jgi:hypothetical protein
LRLDLLKHLLDPVLDLLLAGNTRRVNVVHTRTNVAWVSLVNKDLQQLSIALAVLNGEYVSIESSDGVEEVLELGVAEVGVNLSRIRNTGSGKLEAVNGPREIVLTLAAGTEGKTLTEGGLIDLDDVDTCSFEVDDLIAESKGKLLSLDRLVNIITWEGPSQASDWTSKHTLHRLLGDGCSVLGLLDGHWRWTRDVPNDDWWTDAAGAIALHPSVRGEYITIKTLTKVLYHVVAFWLTVDIDIEVKLILDLDDFFNLLFNELLVLLGGNLTLGELVALDSDFFGLWEGANGGSGEKRQLEVRLLLSISLWEWRLAVVHFRRDLRLPLLDLWVIGALGGGT